jgi:DNA-directed RNA polymerase specialized sigma24 family protein
MVYNPQSSVVAGFKQEPFRPPLTTARQIPSICDRNSEKSFLKTEGSDSCTPSVPSVPTATSNLLMHPHTMPSSPLSGEVTGWIQRLRTGDGSAVQHLWNGYFQRMVLAARQRLQGAAKAAADEEDVALSAFNSFCKGAQAGRFPQLLDSHSLWPLLLVITANKSVDLIRQNNRQRRGGGLERLSGDALADALSGLISREPGPEFTAELTDQLSQLLQNLDACGDPLLRQIALLKLEGLGNDEIATRLGCVRRSVERKLQVIARLWEQSEGESG